MLTIDNFVFDTLKRLDEINIGNCLDIRSYKKNRKVVIEKLENGFNLYEDGFYKEEKIAISIEMPYDEFILVKKAIENYDGEIETIEYIDIIKVRANMLEENFKDKLEIKIFKF